MKNFPEHQHFSTVQFVIQKRSKRLLGFGHLKLISMVTFSLKALDWSINIKDYSTFYYFTFRTFQGDVPCICLPFIYASAVWSHYKPNGWSVLFEVDTTGSIQTSGGQYQTCLKRLTKMALSSSNQLSWVYVTVDEAKCVRWFFFASSYSTKYPYSSYII